MKGSVTFMIIGFIVIILAGYVQQIYLQKSSKKLLESINALEILANHDKISEADGKIAEVKREWEKIKKIWKILVYHDEIYPIEETLAEVCVDLERNLENSQISSKFELLKMYIKNVSDNNQFILENIL